LIDNIVVATGPGSENEPVRDEAMAYGVDCPYVEAPEEDVLLRYLTIALGYRADVIVRITGDCPLIDAEVVDETIMALGNCDFSTNVMERTYPRGFDCEVMTLDTLLKLHRLVKGEEREHVCSYIYHSDRFAVASVQDDVDHSDLTWCVDTQEDFERVAVLLKHGILPYEEMLEIYGESDETFGDGDATRSNREADEPTGEEQGWGNADEFN